MKKAVFNVKPRFLYPTSEAFPFDPLAKKIVKAIKERNWQVPGLTLEYWFGGRGEAKTQHLYKVIGEDFVLKFSSDRLEDITIPKQKLETYSDNSGPTYYLYVGKDYEADKHKFMYGWKVNSKLNGEPRIYLRYSGERNCGYETRIVKHDNDLGREYDPQGDEPRAIQLKDIYKGINIYLGKILADILRQPVAAKVEQPWKPEQLIPYDRTDFPVVYTTCDARNARKLSIAKGLIDPEEYDEPLEPEQRYFFMGGTRLANLGVSREMFEAFPKVAYGGFVWLDPNQSITQQSTRKDIAYDARGFDDDYIVAVRPKYANHVYVIDAAAFYNRKEKIFASLLRTGDQRSYLTDSELNACYAVRAVSLVPITEYRGGYEQPLVLIQREIGFEEIEWVAKSPKVR